MGRSSGDACDSEADEDVCGYQSGGSEGAEGDDGEGDDAASLRTSRGRPTEFSLSARRLDWILRSSCAYERA